ncbi:MAG: hypothetical protein IJ737_01460 [Ruminococcus sp.]|nr:hypothetical protein [Ruminococcus sp.]
MMKNETAEKIAETASVPDIPIKAEAAVLSGTLSHTILPADLLPLEK